MAALFHDLPEAIENTERLAERLQFSLTDLGYEFPVYPVEPGETMDTCLRKQTYAGARRRYEVISPKVEHQLEHELALISKLGFDRRLDLALVEFIRCDAGRSWHKVVSETSVRLMEEWDVA